MLIKIGQLGLNALGVGIYFGPFRSIFSPGSPLILQKFFQPIDQDGDAFGFRIEDDVGPINHNTGPGVCMDKRSLSNHRPRRKPLASSGWIQ